MPDVRHFLVDRNGLPIREAVFAPGVVWKPGDVVFFGPAEQNFRVLERRELHQGSSLNGDVELVVEPT